MLGATNVVITSEWRSVVYNTQVTDVTGLENGSFSYVVTNQVEAVAVGFKLLPVTNILVVLAVQTSKAAAKA